MKKISIYHKHIKWTGSAIFILIIMAGILIGSLADTALSECRWLVPFFASFPLDFSIMSEVRRTFLFLFIFVTVSFAAGLFAIGQPLAMLQLIYCGISIGTCTASMYRLYGKSALLPVLIVVLPKAAAVITVAVLSVRESVRNSLSLLFCFIREGNQENARMSPKLYCIRYIVLIILSLTFSVAVGAFIRLFESIGRL